MVIVMGHDLRVGLQLESSGLENSNSKNECHYELGTVTQMQRSTKGADDEGDYEMENQGLGGRN